MADVDPVKKELARRSLDSSSTSTLTGDVPMTDSQSSLCQGITDDGTPDAMTGVETQTDAQLDTLGREVKRLVGLIDELQQLGVEASTDIPLPKIIVVGDQSAGKSSLIEGLSGIRVPRSSGTCTRCPLQITLISSTDDTVEYKVTLQKKYSYDPNASDNQGRYGKWSEDPTPTDTIFAILDNKAKLEDVLRRAQWATLNPGDPVNKYLTASSVTELPLKVEFSPNVVHLDIMAPSQPNLSFIDLPGIIRQTATAKDKWLVSLVENFVTDYIEQGNSLILLARSMESDFVNSSAAALIQECRALDRTVGCLTKPDRFPDGDPYGGIHAILSGSGFEVGHGYFVTKQPNQAMLDEGISTDKARQLEEDFFNRAPWNTEFDAYQDRFGTLKLRDSLSVKLVHQITQSLPIISEKVHVRLRHVNVELSGYPDPPDNAQGRVFEALSAFAISFDKHVQGVHPHIELRNVLRQLAVTFHKDLNQIRPGLIVQTPRGFRHTDSQPDPVMISLLSDDDADRDETPCPVEDLTPQKKRKLNVVTPSSSKKFRVTSPAVTQTPGKKTFKLLDIRSTLEKLAISDVPSEIDPRAVDHLRLQTCEGWEQPMLVFIRAVNEQINTILHQLLQESCASWLKTEFFREASKITTEFVGNSMAKQLSCAHRALLLEQRKPFTMNDEGFKLHRAKELKILQNGRVTQRIYEKLEASDRAAGKLFERNSEHNKKKAEDPKLRAELGEDPFDQEVNVMASVRGYHNVALLRFLDHVVQGVQVEVLDELVRELPGQLRKGLMVEVGDVREHCSNLLAEDREREARRKELKREKENLEEARRKLRLLEDFQNE